MATVEARGIKKFYGHVAAVNGVDLATRDGEFLVLLGPSGCGKTTLLRMIAGFEKPTAGDLLIGGEIVHELAPRARPIAMVFQSYALYPHMTVFNNIAFPLKAQRVDRAALKQKVDWAAGLFGIGHLLERKPRARVVFRPPPPRPAPAPAPRRGPAAPPPRPRALAGAAPRFSCSGSR